MGAHAIDEVISFLKRLPGIGERTATRLAFHLLRAKPQFREGLARSLERLSHIHFCSICQTVTETDPCALCQSPVRNADAICIVEKPSDIYPIERLQTFHGRYHVLHGLLSPMEGISPADLKIHALIERISVRPPEEIILALSPTVEGDATCHYLAQMLAAYPLRISRLAAGLPIGSDLEFADQITLGKAFEARTRVR